MSTSHFFLPFLYIFHISYMDNTYAYVYFIYFIIYIHLYYCIIYYLYYYVHNNTYMRISIHVCILLFTVWLTRTYSPLTC